MSSKSCSLNMQKMKCEVLETQSSRLCIFNEQDLPIDFVSAMRNWIPTNCTATTSQNCQSSAVFACLGSGEESRKAENRWRGRDHPQVARAVRPRPSCSVCVLLSSLLLAVNLAKEVKYRGSSIVANKKEVPLLLHSCFRLILNLFS